MGSLPPKRAPLRVAVLECGTPAGQILDKYGSFGSMFARLLDRGARRVADDKKEEPVQFDITTFDVVDQEHYPRIEDVDAVLLTGSKYNAFDDYPWILRLVDFTKQVLAQDRVRVIGVCYGHQIVGRALGAEVSRNEKGWEIAVMPQQLTERGKQLFGVDELNLHQMHRDIVRQYPPEVQPLSHSPVCAVQGMYVPRRLITVQGHPEFNGEIVSMITEGRHGEGIFDKTLYDEAMINAQKKHDGDAVGAAFVRFLLEE